MTDIEKQIILHSIRKVQNNLAAYKSRPAILAANELKDLLLFVRARPVEDDKRKINL